MDFSHFGLILLTSLFVEFSVFYPMPENIKTLTREQGQKILDRLRNDAEYWGEFITSPDVKLILGNAIYATNLQNKITINDFANAIYIYSVTENSRWFTIEMDNPGAIYGYFKKTVKSLLFNRKFMRQLIGIDPSLDPQCESLDVKFDDKLSVGEKLCQKENDTSSEIAEQKIQCFKDIVSLMCDKNRKFGELMYRYYLKGEKAETIALDFLQRGYIDAKGQTVNGKYSEKQLEAAIKNVQNSLLPRARDKFNTLALEMNFELKLEGKIKKSEIKKLTQKQI